MQAVNLEDLRSVLVPTSTSQPTFDVNRLCELLKIEGQSTWWEAESPWIQSFNRCFNFPDGYFTTGHSSVSLLTIVGVMSILQFAPINISNLPEVIKTLNELDEEYSK